MVVNSLALSKQDSPALAPISPIRELGSYEALFLENGATFKRLAEKFASDPDALPSDFVNPTDAYKAADRVIERLQELGVRNFGVRINKAGDYPDKLRHAKYPVELLYYQGAWELTELPSVAVVGSRKPSEKGIIRADRLARELVSNDFVVVSGLASGIDSAAHKAAIAAGGFTIGVIGTPIGSYYPKENREMQDLIAREHLLISQVPVLRYDVQPFQQKRHYFPERNATMSALTQGTIIVEAGETSGTLTQARAALFQGRKLFILDNCFKNPKITWPARFEKMGAIRVKETKDILQALS